MHRFFYITLVLCASFVISQSTFVTIPLNKTLTYNDKELYGDFIYLNNSTLEFNFTDISKKLSFIIFQVHSHLYNVNIVRLYNNISSKLIEGTNLGLYSSVDSLGTFRVGTKNNFKIKLFVTVHGYNAYDPIPGGCNSEFPTPIAPYMKSFVVDKSYVQIEAPSPQKQNTECVPYLDIEVLFYMKYLHENDFNPDVYFETIRSMTTKGNIESIGTLIPLPVHKYWQMRRLHAAYPGTGAVYVAIAKKIGAKTNPYSVYVPTYSYACSPLLEYDCELIDDDFTMLLNAALFFIGIFICYFGHRFFKTQILTVGFLSGFVVTYILLSLIFGIDGPALVFASALSGLCIGALRVVTWWLYGIPIYVIVMAAADIGFLAASFLYYVSPGGWSYLQIDFNFWSHFILIMLIITICLLTITYVANLVCCAVIGAYTAIYPLDYYLGGNLKFILNNTIKRAIVKDFNKAFINPPWQWRDIFLLVVWISLSVTGFLYQFYYNRGRPPFPPPPRSVRAVPELPAQPSMARPSLIHRLFFTRNRSREFGERTPLLT